MGVSIHVTDCMYGRPAAGMNVSFDQEVEGIWKERERGVTADDGRFVGLPHEKLTKGLYRLTFDLDGYYARLGSTPFHPRAAVEFRVGDSRDNCHIPLMVTPHFYSTCQGTDDGATATR
jgi:5-hydroxyisourate hydrolase